MFQKFSKNFRGSVKDVSTVFQGKFNGERPKCDSREVQENLKEGCLKGVLKVLRKFQESIKFISGKFKKTVKGVSLMFSFAILLLPNSHRSYTSRRRALCMSDVVSK